MKWRAPRKIRKFLYTDYTDCMEQHGFFNFLCKSVKFVQSVYLSPKDRF
jgi:hypothetical protein